MAVPTERSTSTSVETGNVTTHSILLPATIESGDLLIVRMAMDGAPTVTWDNTTAGTWTSLADTANGTACRLVIYAKIADGTEDGLTLSITTSASEQSVSRVSAFTTWLGGSIAADVDCPVAATGTTTTPDPPVAADAWGNVDRRTIAVCGYDFSRTVTVYPTDYADNQSNDTSGGGAGCGLASAGRGQLAAGVQNPGTYTIDASDQWVAATISIKGTVGALPNAKAVMALLGVGF